MSSITWTEFASRKADAKWQRSSTWPDLIERLRTGRGRTKADCPWLKLASFGDQRTPDNCLRHDANIVMIFGVEGDYDRGEMQPEEALALLEKALIKAIVYHLADGRMVLVDVGASRVLTDAPAVAEELLRRMAVNAGLHYLGTGNAKP